jgi:hypothetical protein
MSPAPPSRSDEPCDDVPRAPTPFDVGNDDDLDPKLGWAGLVITGCVTLAVAAASIGGVFAWWFYYRQTIDAASPLPPPRSRLEADDAPEHSRRDVSNSSLPLGDRTRRDRDARHSTSTREEQTDE